jgi:ATP dependent DNA ligase domain
MGQERPPIVFYAFDLLWLNGKDLQGLPIEERKAKLEELLKKPPGVIKYSVSFTKDIQELLDRARTLGLEGLIGKRAVPSMRPESGLEHGSRSSCIWSKSSSLADTPDRKDRGSILALCWWVSMRARNLNLLAELEPGLAKNFSAHSFLS